MISKEKFLSYISDTEFENIVELKNITKKRFPDLFSDKNVLRGYWLLSYFFIAHQFVEKKAGEKTVFLPAEQAEKYYETLDTIATVLENNQ